MSLSRILKLLFAGNTALELANSDAVNPAFFERRSSFVRIVLSCPSAAVQKADIISSACWTHFEACAECGYDVTKRFVLPLLLKHCKAVLEVATAREILQQVKSPSST